MKHLLARTRGRVRRWLVAAALCLLATFITAGALITTAWFGGGSKAPSEASARAQSLVSGLSMPDAPAARPPASLPSEDDAHDPSPPPTPQSADFIWPADGYIVQGMWAGHPSGIDIGASTGDPIHAVRDGKVVFAGGDPCCSYGYFIIIQHDDGWSSLYGHMSKFEVQYGDEVTQGELIGRVGMTGKADGPHVHFELRSYGGVVDPLNYLWPHGTAPPPPPYVASDGQPQAPAAPAAAQPEPTPVPETGAQIAASYAIGAAINWMAAEADASYQIDTSTCTATASGPNWRVSCRAVLNGCADLTACSYLLSACVLSQPLLVTSVC